MAEESITETHFETLLAQQMIRLKCITNVKTNLKKKGRGNFTTELLKGRLAKLNSDWDAILSLHADLTVAASPDHQNDEYFATSIIEKTQEIYEDTMDYINEELERLLPHTIESPNANSTVAQPSSYVNTTIGVKLPKLDVAKFSGSVLEWPSFSDLFSAAVRRVSIYSGAQKLQYLKLCLSGEALSYIRHLEILDGNFEAAWKILDEQYNNPRVTIEAHLARITQIESIREHSSDSIKDAKSTLTQSLAALRNLGCPTSLWDHWIVHTISHKLDIHLRREWEQFLGNSKKFPTYAQLHEFLCIQLNMWTAMEGEEITHSIKRMEIATGAKSTAKVHATGARWNDYRTKESCTFCNQPHIIYRCGKFLELPVKERYNAAKQNQLCINCLRSRHGTGPCPSKSCCRLCLGRHHTLLHIGKHKFYHLHTNNRDRYTMHHRKRRFKHQRNSVKYTHNHGLNKSILLPTALVNVCVADNSVWKARALLDQCSQASFVTESFAKKLRIPTTQIQLKISGLGGNINNVANNAAMIKIRASHNKPPEYETIAHVIPRISAYEPPARPQFELKELSEVVLADPDPFSTHPFDLLIGADLYGKLLSDGLKKVGNEGLTLQKTSLGWIIAGATPDKQQTATELSTNITTLESLDSSIRKFWESESIPLTTVLTPDEQACEAHFESTHSRDASGKLVVRLPFNVRNPDQLLGNTRKSATAALYRLEKSLEKNKELRIMYNEFIKEYIDLGHMSRLPNPEEARVLIPHRAVLREDSQTTKLRVVFNATSSSSSGRSLNDVLRIGPKLQTDLTSIILRWRMHRFVLVADVEKMFRQIWVHPDDRKYQCILWRDLPQDPIAVYKLNTVTYGTSCAPYLAIRAIQKIVDLEGQNFPNAVNTLRNNVYVDDVFMGSSSVQDLKRIRTQVCGLLDRGGFHLRKWAGNAECLLEDIPRSDHSHAVELAMFDQSELKVLGIRWLPAKDNFYFNLQRFKPSDTNYTKRVLFSEIAKLYDPLGWLSPVVIRAKILLQAQWLEKMGWDEPVSQTTQAIWNSFCIDWEKLNQFRIPRWVHYNTDSKIELHGFCDASAAAFSAVVYLRTTDSTKTTKTCLLMAKSKVAPIKTQSIPTLELNGAVLLVELLQHIRNSLSCPVSRTICWTDSMITLAWIRKHPSTWKVLIANRVSKIQTIQPEAMWRHVRTKENPADLNSRGVTANELLTSKIWLHGPEWIDRPESDWPAQPVSFETTEGQREKTVHIVTRDAEWEALDKFSSWSKLIRVVAYCFKFYHAVRARIGARTNNVHRGLTTNDIENASSVHRGLTANDIENASKNLIGYVQRLHFTHEITRIEVKKPSDRKSKIISLAPFLDKDKILRVGGRLRHSYLQRDAKFPILLPKHRLSTLLLQQYHLCTLHGGLQLSLRTAREKYWILGATNALKAIIRSCVVCARQRAETLEQRMQDLQPERCRPARAFTTVGLDYAGPYLIRDAAGRGRTAHKAYIAAFICYTYRAIHLELVHDYSTKAFLAAFSRFIARRGLPAKIVSDNGTNFVGADRELQNHFKKAYQSTEFKDECAMRGLEWHFNPPAAPHFNGLSEAGVKSVKYHLKRILGEFKPTVEEMSTLLCKIEACLNSRPVSALTEDSEELDVLTPGHYLVGGPLLAPPSPRIDDTPISHANRWRAIEHMHQQMWRRWTQEYLLHLQQRNKWKETREQLQMGDIVLLKNPNLPPTVWDLARVSGIMPGKDGLIRVVKVRTARSEYQRPITQLVRLPCRSTDRPDQ